MSSMPVAARPDRGATPIGLLRRLAPYLLAALVLAGITVVASPSGAGGSKLGLKLSRSSDRANAVALDGSRLSDPVFIYADSGFKGATDFARFVLNGASVGQDPAAPYDLKTDNSGAPLPLDPASLPDGRHTLTVELVRKGSVQQTVSATFTVGDASAPVSSTEPAPTTSTTSTTVQPTTSSTTTGPVVDVPANWAYAVNTGTGCPASTSAADDVTDRMNALLNDGTKVPDDVTVRLTSNGCYRLDRTIWVNKSVGLVLEGAGATFRRFVHAPRTYPFAWGYPHFVFAGGSNLTVRNLTVKGLNTTSFATDPTSPQVSWMFEPMKFGSGCTDNCFESGFIVSPMDGLLMENLFIDATFGDGITLGGEHDFDLVRNAVLRNIDIDRNGRQGVSPTTVDNVLLDDVNILHGYAVAYDTEVNGTGITKNVEIRNSYANVRTVVLSVGHQGAQGIYFHDNVIKHINPSWPWAVFDNGPVSGIRIVNNVIQNKRDEVASIVLANASGYNEIVGNVSQMNEPPAVRQGNRYSAIVLGNEVTSGGLNGAVTGTIVIKGNDFGRYTDLATRTNSTATIVACGNQLLQSFGFTQPTVC